MGATAAVESDEILPSRNQPIEDRSGDGGARGHAREHAPVAKARAQSGLQEGAGEENEEKGGEGVFADQAEAGDETEQQIVADPAPLHEPHEGPHRGRDRAYQRHGVGHALMQVPADLIEQER